jgi:hypothetical protein
MGTKLMGTKLSLTIAVGIFLVTMLLFAAAMVIASALSIPEPAARFLPFSARGLPEAPSEQPSSGLSLTNDLQPGGAQSQGEPVPTVTAVPELPSRTPSMVSSGGGVVSSTHTRTAVHRPATTRNRHQAGSEGPGRFWSWPGLNRLAPREPISTPSPTPSPQATPRSPTSKSPASEPAASEPAASEPAASEPAASEPAPSEPAAPPASELATELPGP